MKFQGVLSDTKLFGFYRSRYEHEGQTHYMAVTQFEPCGRTTPAPLSCLTPQMLVVPSRAGMSPPSRPCSVSRCTTPRA